MTPTLETLSEILTGVGCEVREHRGRLYVNSTPNGGRGDYGYLIAGDNGHSGSLQNITRRAGEIGQYVRKGLEAREQQP